MKRVEIESFAKSFVLFFSSISLLVGVLFYLYYAQERAALENRLLSQMRLCSFDLNCEQFGIDFSDANTTELYTLQQDDTGLYSYFPITQSTQYVLKFSLERVRYEEMVSAIKQELVTLFFGVLVAVLALSVLFSYYALHPLRQALRLTEEFIKDILHDFNTPLSAIRLNVGMIKREQGGNARIERVEQGVETIFSLQENLRSYLGEHALQQDTFALENLVEERIAHVSHLYPSISFASELQPCQVNANKSALTRIVDNLLSNAAKYNVDEGTVTVILDSSAHCLKVIDTGRGIKEPSKVFERFYKEHERGMGIGLHIVKKLCDEMGIRIDVQSRPGEGSTFSLDIKALIIH